CEVIARPEDISRVTPTPKLAVAGERFVCGSNGAYSLELVSDRSGSVSEIRVSFADLSTRYRVTSATTATYAAEELDPKAPDAVGSLLLNRLTGEITTTHRASPAAVALLVKRCDGQLSEDACMNEMQKTKGGNPFACIAPSNCAGWRSKSNILA